MFLKEKDFKDVQLIKGNNKINNMAVNKNIVLFFLIFVVYVNLKFFKFIVIPPIIQLSIYICNDFLHIIFIPFFTKPHPHPHTYPTQSKASDAQGPMSMAFPMYVISYVFLLLLKK